MNIDEAIKVAEAATPGRWVTEKGTRFDDDGHDYRAVLPESGSVEDTICECWGANHHPGSNAAHIARFDPHTVLALLKFVQAWDECTDALPVGFYGPDEAWREWGKLKDARAAVDEALK